MNSKLIQRHKILPMVMQRVDSFSVCPQIWERKAKLTCLIKHFQTRANWQRSLKGNKKNPLRLKVTEFQSKVSFLKKPHPSTTKWERSSCWSQNIPCFCGWIPGSETYSWDSNEKSKPKPRYHKLSQESLESIKKNNNKKSQKTNHWSELL